MKYFVIARIDDSSVMFGDGTIVRSPVKGKYCLVTSRSFDTFELAETYADGVAPSREPKILLEVTALDEL